MRKFLLPFLLILSGWFVACRETPQPHPAAAEATSASADLVLALTPTMESLPFYYAAETGIFQKHHLQVKVQHFAAQFDVDTALLGTTAQAGITDMARVAYHDRKQRKLVALMGTQGDWKLIANAGARINKAEQLGKRLVGTARYSASDYYFADALRKTKLSYDDCFHPQVNDYSIRLQMLMQRQIDAAILPEPFATKAIQTGHTLLYDTQKSGTPMIGCLAANRKFLTEKKGRERLQQLLLCYNEAVAQLNKNGASACQEILIRYYGLDEATAALVKLPQYQPAGPVSEASLSATKKYLDERNLSGITNDKTTLTDFSLLPQK